jgi:sporulation protein YlmC with PRC-barrel domain
VRELLDHELVDSEGVPCGVVDDVMLDGGPGAPLRVVALIVGPGGWLPRLPSWVGGLLRHVVHATHVRVPWSAVAHVGERIELASTASELGLGVADRRIGRILARIPGGLHAPE